jgi:hypothetical protein
VEPRRDLVLTARDADSGSLVSWEFLLEPLDADRTRLLVRGCVSARWPGGPSLSGPPAMQARQLRGIKRRAEA